MSNQRPRPTSDQIRQVLHHAAALYLLGGPPVTSDDGSLGALEPDEFYGFVIASLEDDTLDKDPQAYQAFLADWYLDTAAGLRALMRLCASSATMYALSWVLQEPAAYRGPMTMRRVMEEATGLPWL